MFTPIKQITSRTLNLSQENIDTDQIIPARFLTTTSQSGLGDFAFYDWRYDESGNPRNSSPLPQKSAGEREILVAGANFGCGSSREHAPWALRDFGFRAVISTKIADIFKGNALKNRLLPVEVDTAFHEALMARPGARVAIDLEAQTVRILDDETAPKASATFETEPFARQCLLNGVDSLGHLMQQLPAIEAYEANR